MKENSDSPSAVTFVEMATATGFGPRQVRRLIREGLLPGRIVGRKLLLSRGEWERWLAGDWKPHEKIQTLYRRGIDPV